MSYFGTDAGDLSPDEMYGREPIPGTAHDGGNDEELEPFERGPCSVCHGSGVAPGRCAPCEDCMATGYHWTRDELANYEPSEADLTMLNGPQ